MENEGSKKTALNLNENIEGMLCYLLTWITGIVFLVLEKENKFVKFHAIQSIATFLPLMVISYILKAITGWIPFIEGLISFALSALYIILWAVLLYKAYTGEMFKLPVVGDFAQEKSLS